MRTVNCILLVVMVALFGVLVSSCASVPSARDSTESSSGGAVSLADDAAGSLSPAVEALDRYVLVIQETSSGHVMHSWRPVEEFDLSQFRFQPRAEGTYGRIVLAAGRERDCDQENLLCWRNCMRARIPWHLGHIKPPRRGAGAKAAICSEQCEQSYNDCLKAQGLRALEFSAIDGAVDWLSQNRNEVLLGGIVVIAGIAFWVFPPTAIAGAVVGAAKALFVLVPVAALASSEVVRERNIVAVAP